MFLLFISGKKNISKNDSSTLILDQFSQIGRHRKLPKQYGFPQDDDKINNRS